MRDYTTPQRLAAGVVVATVLHFVVVPTVVLLLTMGAADASSRDGQRDKLDAPDSPRDAKRDERKADRDEQRDTSSRPDDERDEPREQPEEEDKVILGSDDAPERVSLAWLSYEDYLKLQAPHSDVLQPATQTQVDPTPVAAMPDEPTPPAPIAPEPQVVAMARAGSTTAEPGAQSPQVQPSQSLVPLPGPAANRPEVRTPAEDGDAPTNQAAADAPMKLADVPPADQVAADAALSAMGEPTEMQAVKPVDVPATDEAPGPAPRAEGSDLALVNQDHATGPDTRAAEPMAQPAANTDTPDPAGVPTQQDPAESPLDEEGTPVAMLASKTEQPDPIGDAATNRVATATNQASTAVAPRNDDGSARDVQPAPQDRDKQTTPPSAQPVEARPTAAPRTESESPPASPDAIVDARPGQVITAAGVEVRTATPQFSLITRITALPTNPLVRVTFNREGDVIEAKFIKSTGYDNVDSPILSSLYKWKATGKKLDERGKGFSIIVRLKLTED